LVIATVEGVMEANPGDYVIKGVAGEFYPCKPDIFEQTYEPVTENGWNERIKTPPALSDEATGDMK
jgi:hypothetical protein